MSRKGKIRSDSPFRAILNTNTQTRRLGYLVHIASDVKSYHRGERELISRLEKWGGRSEEKLREYVSDKGIVRESRSSSGARRYIDISERLGIITDVRNRYRPSKIGSVITSLESPVKDNPFHLDQAQIPLLYSILLKDSDYTIPLLFTLTKCKRQSDIRSNFYSKLLDHFYGLYEISKGGQKRRIDERIQEMEKWEKPEKYLEHIVMPRLHWGLDLKLVDWDTYLDNGSFSLSRAGRKLLDAVPQCNEIPQISVAWCQNELFKVWAQYSLENYKDWGTLAQRERINLIEDRVKEASGIFHTMAYPRLPALQIILFSIVTLLYRDQIAAGFDDIKQSLQKEANRRGGRWDFRWFQSDDDGFIRIRD